MARRARFRELPQRAGAGLLPQAAHLHHNPLIAPSCPNSTTTAPMKSAVVGLGRRLLRSPIGTAYLSRAALSDDGDRLMRVVGEAMGEGHGARSNGVYEQALSGMSTVTGSLSPDGVATLTLNRPTKVRLALLLLLLLFPHYCYQLLPQPSLLLLLLLLLYY